MICPKCGMDTDEITGGMCACTRYFDADGNDITASKEIFPTEDLTPYKCPVCDGTGKVSRPPWVAGDVPTWPASTTGELHDCQACKGTGVVWRAA